MPLRPHRQLLFALAIVLCSSSAARAGNPAVDGAWTQLDPGISHPSDRREQIAIYDRHNNQYLMFGGYGYASTAPEFNFNEVWVLSMSDPPTWQLVNISGTAPGPRKEVQWGYDVARRRLLVFGGYGEHYAGDPVNWQNDVWELLLDGQPRWREIFPSGTPPQGRLAGIAVFDPKRQRFIGFGGTAGAPVDTWSLELRGQPQWTTIPTGGQHPNGAYGMGSIYDPIRDRMVVFGGSLGAAYYGSQNNVWQLTLDENPTWTQLYPGGTPPSPRRSMVAVYDPLRDRMIIYGGFDAVQNSDQFLPDAHALSLSGDFSWQTLTPDGTIPSGRDVSAGIYDPTHDRMVIFGGWSGTQMLGDTQFLTWAQPATASDVSGSGSATMQAATLQWNVQQATGDHAAVFRKTDTGEWTSLATVDADASGAVAYTDNTVAAGQHYSYELVVSDHTGDAVDAGQLGLTIPNVTGVETHSGAEFSLRPTFNPGSSLDFSVTLPDGGSARLDVIDVTGRTVSSRDVGALGAGPHRVNLSSAKSFTPGVYFVRLSRGNQVLTTRFALLGN